MVPGIDYFVCEPTHRRAIQGKLRSLRQIWPCREFRHVVDEILGDKASVMYQEVSDDGHVLQLVEHHWNGVTFREDALECGFQLLEGTEAQLFSQEFSGPRLPIEVVFLKSFERE